MDTVGVSFLKPIRRTDAYGRETEANVGALDVAHDAEDDGEVDLDGHVVLRFAALDGHVEDDTLLAHQPRHRDPRMAEVEAGGPHRRASRWMIVVLAKLGDERVAALGYRKPRAEEAGRPRDKQALFSTKELRRLAG